MSESVYIIAEAGTNHNGSLSVAKELVDVAVKAGADSVKFQLISPSGLYLPKFYKDGVYEDNSVFQKRTDTMLSDSEYRVIAEYCCEKKISFSASVFDKKGVDLLDDLNVPYIKVASCDLNNSKFLREISGRGRKVVISTGMGSLCEIEQAIADVFSEGNTDIVLMHCVSVYPCPMERMNLGFIQVLRNTFGFPVGLSDHTLDNHASAIAIGMGVEWIEKHFTLDRSQSGFDHSYALEPEGLSGFIKDMRSSRDACERQHIKVGAEEELVKQRARRSLYAARIINHGEKVKESDILVVRPEGHLKPNDIPRLIGKTARKVIHQYESISWDMFE